ncbi:hypothetical protein GCM10010129_76110 [Streptomyces fumigatiscleroticus]|nr:hypothetical protein GCM10010129_76110 [Streptomyces fumigatiscleroticus]
MTDQSYGGGAYEGYDGYEPYRPQQQHQNPHQQQHQNPHQQHQDPYQHHSQHQHQQSYQYQQPGQPQHAQMWPGQPAPDGAHTDLQYTQQWQGQTWETHIQPPVSAAETAYLPPQSYPGTPPAYGAGGHAAAGAHPPAAPEPQPYRQPQQQQPHQQQQQRPYHHQQQPQRQPQPQQRSYQQPQQPQPAQPAQPQHQEPPAAAGTGDEPEYGPATLGGNARVTDAQRARAEGRSPIIDPGIQPAGLTALLGLLLAGTAALGTYALLVPLVVLQAVTAAGWFRLNGMWPARQGIALGFAGGLVADAALLLSDRSPAAILGTLGVWVLLSLVLQLRSHADPDERMYGLMATVASAALAIIAGGYLTADADAVTVGAVAVAVAVLARALPLPGPASLAVSVLAAAGAGIATGAMTGLGPAGALLAAGAAVCALIGHRVAAYDYPSRFVHFTAGVALPLAAAAPVVYVLGRAIA